MVILTLLLLLAPPAAADPADDLRRLLGPAAAVDDHSARAIESWALQAAAGRARRDGDRLILSLDGGGTLDFTDFLGTPQDGEYWDAVHHLFRAVLGPYFLIERRAYGRTHGVLVHGGSGTSWTVPGRPLPAPDASRFLALAEDGLQIWRLADDHPRVELDLTPRQPPRFHGWDGSDRVGLDLGGTVRWLERGLLGGWTVPEEVGE